jgi:hypothetical protein
LSETPAVTHLLGAYNELCNSYRAIDDFRTKLLSFLPLVTGGGLVLLSGQAVEIRKEFFGPVGRFGILVTLGLLAYELFGIKKCHSLIQAGKALERDMHIANGQFTGRPNNLLWVVNEPFAAALIYPAVLGAWVYVALFYEDPMRGKMLSVYAFFGGFALILLYDAFLRIQDKFSRCRKLRQSSHEECNSTKDK